jgi:DNA-binding GntR family transcriptional regulator
LETTEDFVKTAYWAIKEWVTANYLGASLPLPQQKLADEFGMSKTPIREALSRLAVEGFVELVPNRGYWVPRLTSRDVNEIYEIREGLEGIAARIIANIIDDSVIENLKSLFKSIPCEHEVENRSILLEDAGEKLHLTILEQSRNERMSRILGNLNGQLDLIKSIGRRAAAFDPSVANTTFEEHVKIIEALSSRDPDYAEQAMREHLQNSRVRVLSMVLNMRPPVTRK